ncbi:diguanylate cyclase [Pseudomonas sp. R-28-1W-6]|uniref:TackOD1 domain-containing metal-binding protein n=1 Tax=Pseudomonas sp. R-28-1W-6 TaxID=2650101 RepID=UPI00136620A7|nr:diguanylate cyclase [Pseudomonas sp. R-28-1W-6]MWV11122.1 diguanylate cyclase [Pseudomonas sp. R-28-1W-6]
MSDTLPRVAVLRWEPQAQSNSAVVVFTSVEALLAQPPFDVLLLDLPSADAGQALRRLRRAEAYHFSLIYCTQEPDAWGQALGDGKAPANLALLEPLWRLWRERLALFNRGRLPERLESRVLAWLWLRPKAQLRALGDAACAQHYRYPLVEALAGEEGFNAHGWLQLMQQKDWLEATELLDRVRLCGSCGSGRLNYVDVCPECHALDIVRQPSLHCFTCGHVGAQEEFLKDGVLICPNCYSRLRHIGSDYDRPLENYRCRACQAFFVDSAVDARCLDCGVVHSPDRLRVREVRHFQLSESGRLRCHQGLEGSSAADAYFQRLNLTGEAGFHELLGWQLALIRRYGEPGFSLLGLRVDNLDQVFAELGEMRGHALIDALVERVQQIIRDTDRCARSSEDVLWMLLPRTPAAGLQRLQERLLEGAQRVQNDALQQINLRMVGFTAPEDMQAEEDAPLLLARLATGLN